MINLQTTCTFQIPKLQTQAKFTEKVLINFSWVFEDPYNSSPVELELF